MPDRRQDRRVRRTKRRLKEALLDLIEERDYDEITISDITERADIGRSTFYSHFDSKEDLLFSGFDRWLRSLAEVAPAETAAEARAPTGAAGRRQQPERARGRERGPVPTSLHFRFSLPLLRHIRSQKRFFKATLEEGSNARMRRQITALLAEPVRLELDRMFGPPRGPVVEPPGVDREAVREAYVRSLVGAFLGLVSWWLSTDRDVSAESVDRIFQRSAARFDRCPAPS